MNRKLLIRKNRMMPVGYEEYEALKYKNGSPNPHGRKYNIKALYNLVRTPGIETIITHEIEQDLKKYKIERC